MGVKPVHVDDAPDLLQRLNDVRFSRDWSYRQLADDIERLTGFAVSAATLQPLLSTPLVEGSKPYDRTLFKIRTYLDAVRDEKPVPEKKRRAS